MKVKLKAALFAVAFGVGISGLLSEYAYAAPSAASCLELKGKCALGNQQACSLWSNLCRICEIEPEAC